MNLPGILQGLIILLLCVNLISSQAANILTKLDDASNYLWRLGETPDVVFYRSFYHSGINNPNFTPYPDFNPCQGYYDPDFPSQPVDLQLGLPQDDIEQIIVNDAIAAELRVNSERVRNSAGEEIGMFIGLKNAHPYANSFYFTRLSDNHTFYTGDFNFYQNWNLEDINDDISECVEGGTYGWYRIRCTSTFNWLCEERKSPMKRSSPSLYPQVAVSTTSSTPVVDQLTTLPYQDLLYSPQDIIQVIGVIENMVPADYNSHAEFVFDFHDQIEKIKNFQEFSVFSEIQDISKLQELYGQVIQTSTDLAYYSGQAISDISSLEALQTQLENDLLSAVLKFGRSMTNAKNFYLSENPMTINQIKNLLKNIGSNSQLSSALSMYSAETFPEFDWLGNYFGGLNVDNVFVSYQKVISSTNLNFLDLNDMTTEVDLISKFATSETFFNFNSQSLENTIQANLEFFNSPTCVIFPTASNYADAVACQDSNGKEAPGYLLLERGYTETPVTSFQVEDQKFILIETEISKNYFALVDVREKLAKSKNGQSTSLNGVGDYETIFLTSLNDTKQHVGLLKQDIQRLYPCQCANGNPVNDLCYPDPKIDQKCTACNNNYYLNTDQICVNNVCTCLNGVPVSTNDCVKHNSESCQSCKTGFYLDTNACQPNVCSCQDGNAAVGFNCLKHNAIQCASCNSGFYLNSANACVINQCTCINGDPVADADCLENTKNQCQTCNSGYFLNSSNACQANTCGCANGTAATEPDCLLDGSNQCQTCDAGYFLNGVNCEIKSCTCSNGVKVADQDCLQNAAEQCQSCDAGYFLRSQATCQVNTCTCLNGTPVPDQECLINASNTCKSCHPGYHLVGNECQINSCTCENGTPVDNIQCTTNGQNMCQTCDVKFSLNTSDLTCQPASELFPEAATSNSTTAMLNSVNIFEDLAADSLNMSDSEQTDLLNSFIVGLSDISGMPVDQSLMETVLENFNSFLRLEDSGQIDSAQNQAQNIEIQKEMEQVLKNMDPNIAYVSSDNDIAIKTTNQASNVYNLPPETLNVFPLDDNTECYSYDSTIDSKMKIYLPTDNFANITDCNTPLSVMEFKNAKHLATEDPNTRASVSSVAIETCLPPSITSKLPNPILINFNYANDSVTQDLTTVPPVCTYYNTEYNLWLPINNENTRVDTVNQNIICESDHLTYFSLLFRTDDLQDNQILTVLDILFSIISILLMLICAINYLMIDPNLAKKMMKKPLARANFFSLVSCTLMLITFLFGQQFFYPINDDVVNCLNVALVLQFIIVVFFISSIFSVIIYFLTVTRNLKCARSILGCLHSGKIWVITLEVAFPYVISGISSIIQYFVIKNYGNDYLYGSIDSEYAYLNMRILSSGKTLCFLTDGYSFWLGTMLYYFIAMGLAILVLLYLIIKICQSAETDQSTIDQQISILKKVVMQFFTIGVCWLSLMITMSGSSIVFDYLFIIFKFLQFLAIFVILNNTSLKKLFRVIQSKIVRKNKSVMSDF